MEISEKALKFIQEHAKDDVNALRLKFGGKSQQMDFSLEFALLQIEARRKAQTKIPSFLEHPLFVFPDTISAEQASNEIIALFHASQLPIGSTILDLTAGLGIDDLTFAKRGINVTACEINEIKYEALKHNIQQLGLANRVAVINVDSIAYIRDCSKKFDFVFADPARRSITGKRLHSLSDCQPDIMSAMKDILNVTNRILIKSSPLLDLTFIRDTVSDLRHIYVVCLKGECKEVLIDIEKGSEFSGVTVVDLDSQKTISKFECTFMPVTNEYYPSFVSKDKPTDYMYLYEPNAGVMKTGAWGELSMLFPNLRKADSNTHLFLSDSLIEGFPGRTLTISGQPDKKALKALKGTNCNVVVRNYTMSAQEVAKKYSLIPGGDRFLYAFRYKGKPVCLIAEPLRKTLKVQEQRNQTTEPLSLTD
ncbi:MAG: class I SAM-dependent methyltransferase [Muribaculaceae bacterium]|nr:class I SAM-dependent methyltransferase [Muribaculaceae bacterium]